MLRELAKRLMGAPELWPLLIAGRHDVDPAADAYEMHIFVPDFLVREVATEACSGSSRSTSPD